MSVFTTTQLTVSYGAGKPALDQVDIAIEPASFFGVIGPNGSGKSTLIRALLGAVEPTGGSVLYENRALSEWSRRDLALRIGVVAQLEDMAFPITVRDLVGMGRYPHMGALRAESVADRAAIADAMERCSVAALADRTINTLSGGERQRARIARALAQQPRVLVLDEPTVALDIAHEMAVFELLRSLSRDDDRTIVIATHHVNLAARYADTLLLLDRGRVVASGEPRAVMQQSILEPVYQWPLLVYEQVGAPQITPLSRP